jgi:hypothetical protein
MTETANEEARATRARKGDASTDAASSPVADHAESCCGDRGTDRDRQGGGQRNRVNFWLDVATALTFCTLVGSGILLEFVLVPRGGGSWLGLRRHDWGEVHFWLGASMLALVVAHLVLHRAWVARCWQRYAGPLHSPATWMLLAAALALTLLPLLVPAQPGGTGRGQGWRHGWDRRAGTVQDEVLGPRARGGQGLRRGRGRRGGVLRGGGSRY